jgi:hypothetical protein
MRGATIAHVPPNKSPGPSFYIYESYDLIFAYRWPTPPITNFPFFMAPRFISAKWAQVKKAIFGDKGGMQKIDIKCAHMI